jgi:hypothetical protein
VSNATATTPGAGIAGDRALAIAQADAVKAYQDPSGHRIQLVLESDGWHVDYDLKDPRLKGEGRITSSMRGRAPLSRRGTSNSRLAGDSLHD